MAASSNRTICFRGSPVKYCGTPLFISFLAIYLLIDVQTAQGQDRTIQSAGTWSNSTTAIWAGNNRADALSENVLTNNNLGGSGIVTLQSSYTIGNFNTGNNNDFVIDDNISLNVGQAGSPRNLNVGNGTIVTIDAGGSLTIWGDINIDDDEELTLNVTGSVTVKGDLNLGSNVTLIVNGDGPFVVEGDFDASDEDDIDIEVNGDMQVQGSFIAGDNLDITVDGELSVDDFFSVEDDADFIVNGDLAIGGDFYSEDNTDIELDGSMSVGGDFNTEEDMDFILTGDLTIDGNVDTDENAYIEIGPNSDVVVGGDFQAEDGLDLIIDGTMDIGDTFIFDIPGDDDANAATITISGDFTVANDFDSNQLDDLNFNVESGGNVNVGDDFLVDDDFDMSIDNGGLVRITDDFVGDRNADLATIAGGLEIGDNLIVDSDDPSSSIVTAGAGYVTFGGSCTGPTGFCSNASTPITLLDFEGTIVQNSVVLNWTTTMEENFDKFVVEHSSDGTVFTTIGNVNGSGINFQDIEKDYTFIDPKPMKGLNYYRLKAVDLDGTNETFKTIAIRYEGPEQFEIFSNPSDGLKLEYKSNFMPSAGDYLSIVNRLGSEVAIVPVTKPGGELNLPEKLPSGLYIIRYRGATFNGIYRVIVE